LESAQIYDIAPTLLYLLDQVVPSDMDGRVLFEAISEEFREAHKLRTGDPDEIFKSDEVEFTPEENAEVIERLKQLGYVG
jgi:hypothetical protein